MERIQGHINPFLYGELMSQEQGVVVDFNSYESCMTSHQQQQQQQQQMPFLHMLQERGRLLEEQNQQAQPSEPSSFQLLLKLQEQRLHHQQQQESSLPRSTHQAAEIDSRHRPPSLELESCVTHVSDSRSETRKHFYPSPFPDVPCCDPQPAAAAAAAAKPSTSTQTTTEAGVKVERKRERRKRKRPRPSSKNMEDVESQRMTHIAVERNRRKLMNDHLCSLCSLMPPSFIQRGDQASIIGGAIDFVKELEQLLQSLQAEKRMRALRWSLGVGATSLASPSPSSTTPFRDFFTSPQYTTYTSPPSASSASSLSYSSSSSSSSRVVTKVEEEAEAEGCCSGGSTARVVADIEATVIQTHVNLKILSPRRPGQLLGAISALEELHLAVLHLNITSLESSVLYCLNLKIEEECKLQSADEIATAVYQIFSHMGGSC